MILQSQPVDVMDLLDSIWSSLLDINGIFEESYNMYQKNGRYSTSKLMLTTKLTI